MARKVIGLLGAVLLLCVQFTGLVYAPVSANDVTRNATLFDLSDAVSGDRMVTELAAVSHFSRCVTDSGHDPAINFLQQRFKDFGYQVELQPFIRSGIGRGDVRLQNIIARKPGTEPHARHLLVAHFDSSPTRMFPPTCDEFAPGANDNGSGVVALLEIARLLGRAQFKDDIELVLFDGEEFGYLGSQHFVSQYLLNRQNQLPIATVVNLDMVGYPRDGTTNQTIYAITVPGSSNVLAHEGEDLVKAYLPGVKYQVYTLGDLFPANRDPNRNSDQRSFWEANVGAAIFLNEDARDILSGDPRYHSAGDILYRSDGSARLDPVMWANATRTALLIAGTKAQPLPRRFFLNLEPIFENYWSRADRPVLTGAETGQSAGRSWTWGPVPNYVIRENYQEAPGGSRQVVYFDKARMELTNPSSGYITNGLLVVELATGRLQLGDTRFEQRAPSGVQVAGDPNSFTGGNDISPTYASFKNIIERGKVAPNTGPVSATVDKQGHEGQNSTLSGYARNSFYVPETGHNIPDVFFNWFKTEGLIYDPGSDSYSSGPVFGDWVATMGLPVTEAYWVRTKVAGVEQDVLVQLFERRALTYTPGNPAAFKVEMGNVGQHYYRWRYGS